MISTKIHTKDFNTLPLRRKLLSQWIFPLGEEFGKNQHEKPKDTINQDLNHLASSVKSTIDAQEDNRSSRMQTYPFLSEVSQKFNQKQNRTVTRSRNSSHGAFLHPLSNKNATFYKKKAPSTEVPNVNELNITSYRNFKIRSPLKRAKNNSCNIKELTIERGNTSQKRTIKIRMGRMIPKKRSLEGLQTSTISNINVKWENSYNTLELQSKIRRQFNDFENSRDRKNSICPWENEFHTNTF